MTAIHGLVTRYAAGFALHLIVSSIVLAIAIAASYLPRLSARTRFAILAAGVAKFLVPASLFAPLMERSKAAGIIQMTMPAIMQPVRMAAAPLPSWTALDWIAVAAAAIGIVFVFTIIVTSLRTVTAALHSALPAGAREVALLSRVRERIGIRHAVDLVRSPISEAPAVLRVLRPLIVLPADGPDPLDDNELESLLSHECAHVARRDNLLALVEGLVRSAFWFNPLVWLAHRRLAEEREKACDEIAADDAERAAVYAQALAKICSAILARPAAGVACMASAHLKQRMEHIMSYNSSRRSAWSHAAIMSFAVIILLAAAAATAAISSGPGVGDEDRYLVQTSIGKIGPDLYVVRISANERSSNVVAWSSRPLRLKAGQTFVARGGAVVGDEPELEFRAEGSIDAQGQLSAKVEVTRGGTVVQHTNVIGVVKDESRYTGAPISMELKDAELRDVLQAFAKLSGLEIVPAADVRGKVDVQLTNVPWDEALDRVLKEHGYTWRVEGNRMTVYRQR